MRSPVTRTLAALPPAVIGAGFAIRTAISDRPPITIVDQLQGFAFWWAIILVALCSAAAILPFTPTTERWIKIDGAIRAVIGCWLFSIAVLTFFRNDPDSITVGFWATRQYTVTGAALGCGCFFISDWWDAVHFKIPALRAERRLIDRYGPSLGDIDQRPRKPPEAPPAGRTM